MNRSINKRIAAAAMGTLLLLPPMSAGAQSLGQPGRPGLVITDDAGAGTDARDEKNQAVVQHGDVATNAKGAKALAPGGIVTPRAPVPRTLEDTARNRHEAERGK